MWFFGLVCFLCLIFAPIVLSYFASNLLMAPVVWAGRTLLVSRSSKKLLAATTRTLRPTTSNAARQLLDASAFTRRTLGTRDHEGEIDGFRVLLRTQPRTVDAAGATAGFPWSRQDQRTTWQVVGAELVVDLRKRIPHGLNLHVHFDAEEISLGSEALIAGLLDGRVRTFARQGDQLAISEGVVSFDSPFAMRDGELEPALAAVIHMARRLTDAYDAEQATIDEARLLLDNLEQDPDPLVRSRAADVLLREFPAHRDEAFSLAREDPSPEVRFAAARHMKNESFDVILDVLHDGETTDGLAERALRHLLRRFPPGRTIPILEDILRKGERHLLRIAVRHLGELRYQPAIPLLEEVTKGRPSREIEILVAQALGGMGTDAAEPPLIELLRSSDVEVQVAAAEALGYVGTRRALPPLGVAKSGGRSVRAAAQAAVHMIRARLGPAGTGALSLVENGGESGRLSLDAAQAGGLSPAQDGEKLTPNTLK